METYKPQVEAKTSKTNWVDNGVKNGISTTALPTNKPADVWEAWWKAIQDWEQGVQTTNVGASWLTNWWRSEEVLWENVNGLWNSEKGVWKTKEYTEITDREEASNLVDRIANESDGDKVLNTTIWDLDWMKTITNPERNAAISINKDWEIIEFVESKNASKDSVDGLIIDAINRWANKINVHSENLAGRFEGYWFEVIWKGRKPWEAKTFFMWHNWDSADVVRNNLWKYTRPREWARAKYFTDYDKGAKYRDEFVEENLSSKRELDSVKWWDWKQNYDNFDKKFTSDNDVGDYIKKSYRSLNDKATPDQTIKYNRELAETKEIFNWHIDTKDIWLVYLNGGNSMGTNVQWQFIRDSATLKVWVTDWFTLPHESTHWFDWKFGQELTWEPVLLSDVAEKLKNKKRPKNIDSEIWELVWDFVDIYKWISKRWWSKEDIAKWMKKYTTDPSERFARFWEAFVNYVKSWKLVNSSWEQFTKANLNKFAEWLWKLDNVRQKWWLSSWKLEIVTHKKKTSIYIPWVWEINNIYKVFRLY